jgi:glutamine synthetase adenylyltransferase
MSEHKPSDIEAFIRMLPDPEAARTFLLRLETVAPLTRPDDLLLSRLLTIAAYSPFLAETVLRHPEYISWLKRETEAEFGRVKSAEQMSEELARFITRSIDADERTRLARFKRRELLRIYLRSASSGAASLIMLRTSTSYSSTRARATRRATGEGPTPRSAIKSSSHRWQTASSR